MVQNLQVNKHDISHKQKEKQKSHDHINRCGKSIYKVQHPFMIKMLSQLGIEGAYLNMIKIYMRNLQSMSYSIGKN